MTRRKLAPDRAPDYALVLERVIDASGSLGPDDRADARRVVASCRELANRARTGGVLDPSESDAGLRVALGRLTETLGRRGSHALPAAALGRAGLADLSGDLTICHQSLEDCHAKLTMFGL